MIERRINRISYMFIALLLILLVYPALVWLVRSWLNNPYYSHGFLILPLAGLLAWRKWPHLAAAPRAGTTWGGLALTAASLGAVVWALRWQNYLVASLALIALLGGIGLYLEGWRRLRHWLFPLLFLAFMVPLPLLDSWSPWFESFTARWATALAGAVGIPAVQQGGEISLAQTSLVVGAPCSGLRSLVSMLTLATAWIYVVEGPLLGRGLMLLAAIPLVALSNVLRIALLLVVAVLWGEEAALTYYHDWSSPILFLLALGLFLLLGKVLGCSRLRQDLF